jgi:hypothetical protein
MTVSHGGDYEEQFQRLLADRGLADPEVFAEVEIYDSDPIFTRLSQLGFMQGLSVAQQNAQLIMAAVHHLDRIERHFASPDPNRRGIVRMVAITSWWADDDQGGHCTDGTAEIVRPEFWVGNLAHEKMRTFKIFRPRSDAARFVDRLMSPAYEVYEEQLTGTNAWCPNWVYVAPTGKLPPSIIGE